jgi:hypothetical protein
VIDHEAGLLAQEIVATETALEIIEEAFGGKTKVALTIPAAMIAD